MALENEDVPLGDQDISSDSCPHHVVIEPTTRWKYLSALKQLFPIRAKKGPYWKTFPLHNVGFLSLMTFSWVNPLMWKAYRHGLTEDDVWLITDKDSAQTGRQRLQQLWEEEVKRKGPEKASLGWTLFRFVRTRLIVAVSALLLCMTFALLGPMVFVRLLLTYVKSTETNLGYGMMLVITLTVNEACRSLAMATMWAISCVTAVRARGAMLSLLFQKILRLKSLKDKSVGQLVNLCANDGQRVFDVVYFGHLVCAGPYVMTVGLSYCIYIMGPSAVVSLLVLLCFYPVQMLFSKATELIRRKCIAVTDNRVRLMNEILNCIKLIKMYAWEEPFAKTIAGIRADERAHLEKSGFIQSLSIATGTNVQLMACVLAFITHTMTGNNLTAIQAFTYIAVLGSMRFVLGSLPYSVKAISENLVGTERIKELLLMEEHEPVSDKVEDDENVVEVQHGYCMWDEPTTGNLGEGCAEDDTKSDGTKLLNGANNGTIQTVEHTLSDINLCVKKGSLVGICGSVGCGKSSLIQTLLGNTYITSGRVAVKGSVAYVSQQAWIINATLRQNIIFNSSFDQNRYDDVIKACGLVTDLKSLPGGDQTEIGERGINLSGGQKQRISLARALYADKDIYLLDDPLSAVDSHVGHHIFTHCISSALKEKTVIFVTHQLQYLRHCDDVLLIKGGSIAEHGSHDILMKADGDYAGLIRSFHETHEESDTDESSDEEKVEQEIMNEGAGIGKMNTDQVTQLESHLSYVSSCGSEDDVIMTDPAQLTKAEEMKQGHLSWDSYRQYFKACGGALAVLLVALVFLATISTITFNTWWLSHWLIQGSGGVTKVVDNQTVISDSVVDNPELSFYTAIYGLTMAAVLVLTGIRAFAFVQTTLNGSSNLHDTVFSRVLQCPMSFFDVTPVGRILTRFSKDLDEIDVRMPFQAETFLQHILIVLSSFVMIMFVFPWFGVAMVPLVALFIFIGMFFRAGTRETKRLDNITRSPVLSHIAASVQGVQVISAFGMRDVFQQKFDGFLNTNTVAFLLFNMCLRWSALRLEIITMTVIFVTGLLCVLTPRDVLSPSYAGMAISYAVQLTGMFQFTIRNFIETEARFTSAERITDYIKDLESEEPTDMVTKAPPADWPSKGQLSFNSLCMKYRKGLPTVLKNIKFDVKPKEKIGIVGRTGSGKSSLASVLFRIVNPCSGSICIDDIDMASIKLKDLRSSLSIIPQEPVLFVGTIRYNLDPFNQHADDELWDALEKCHVKDMVAGLDLQLESPVVENGDNFSVGERQLICMARALLRSAKILVLDEATAAIDTKTDSLIQATIKEAFSDCTTLTIAHRLNTVLNSDKILVLVDGKVCEFDKPSSLLANPDSVFSGMMQAAESHKGAEVM